MNASINGPMGSPMDDIIQTEPIVSNVTSQGYVLRPSLYSDRCNLEFQVFHGGVFVGSAVFRLIHESRQIQNEQIFIGQDHRRRGLGNALYVAAKLAPQRT